MANPIYTGVFTAGQTLPASQLEALIFAVNNHDHGTEPGGGQPIAFLPPALAFPVGGIILWSGSIGTIPSLWYLCNGANGTPDLRDRFIVGAGNTYTPNTTGGATTHSHTQGSLIVPSIPAGTNRGEGNPYGTQRFPVDDNSGGTDSDMWRMANVPVTGTTDTASSLPLYYALAYIMYKGV